MEITVQDRTQAEGGMTALFLYLERLASLMPMTMEPAYFIAWRKRIGLTQAKLSEVLGVNIYTLKKWEGGKRRLPPYIGLLMAAIENGLDPIGAEAMVEVEGSGDE